ncbi:PHP domain-containing protein [Magnetospira thiophila]
MSSRRALFDEMRHLAQVTRLPPPVDFHLHTTWTDGAQGVDAMWRAAVAAGLTQILFSEHSRSNSGGWFDDFAAEVRALPETPCQALVGTEVKIADFEGRLDLSPAIAAACDLVMGSVHRFPGEAGVVDFTSSNMSLEDAVDTEYRLSLAALDNPQLDILGHPFGMTIRRFGGEPPWPLIEKLIRKCAESGKAFEINTRYHDQPDRLMKACLAVDCPVSFGSNAHCVDDVGAVQRHPAWEMS